MKIKNKKCVICAKEFRPYKSLQRVCDVKCSIIYANIKIKEKVLKKARKQKRVGLDAMMTHSQCKKKLQTIFNKFIRIRDQDRGCVSCGTTLEGKKFDAGHFYPTTYQGIRFDERNVHGQCVHCNRDKHGNIHEYRKRITDRITEEDLIWLDDHRHVCVKMTIPELKELIIIYKEKVKNYDKE